MSLTRLFKALSEEPRLQILALLREQELSGAEIVSILGMGQSRVSRHLAVLREAGLVEARRDGSSIYFKVAEPEAEELGARAMEALGADLNEVLDGKIRARLATALRRRRASVSRFFDEKAAEWDALRGELSDELSVLKMLVPLLPPRLRIADLGTGTGALVPHLRRHAAQVVAIDSSPAMLAAANARLLEAGVGQVLLLQADLEALPLRSESSDVAVCHMVLHYTAEPEQIVSEMGRIVRRGGLVAIADLQQHEHEELRERLAHQRLGFTRLEIEEWLEKSGAPLVSFETGTVQLTVSAHGRAPVPMFYAIGKKR